MDWSPSPMAVLLDAVLVGIGAFVYWYMADEFRSLGRRLGVTRRVAVPVFLLAGVSFTELWTRGTVPVDSPGELPFAFAGAGYLGGVVLVTVALGNADTYLRARRSETTNTGMVAPGFVEISGEARAMDDSETAPLSGRDALWYHVEVSERQQLGLRTVRRTIDEGTGGTPFYVDDGTGEVLVDPAGSDVRVGRDRRLIVTVDEDEEPPAPVASFLAERYGLEPGDPRRTYTEWVLEPGTEVYVQGTAESEYAGGYPAGTVLGAGTDGDDCFVMPGSTADVERSLQRTVLLGGAGGLVLTAAGFAGMASMAGVL